LTISLTPLYLILQERQQIDPYCFFAYLKSSYRFVRKSLILLFMKNSGIILLVIDLKQKKHLEFQGSKSFINGETIFIPPNAE